MSADITKYISCVTSEHQSAVNFMALVSAAVQPLADMQAVINGIPALYDIDSAVGSQLDVLGQWIGQSRTMPFQPSNSVSPVLDDATYLILLKAKIAQNQWNGQIGSLYSTWAQLFPGGNISVVDNQNMTCTILCSGAFTSIVVDLINNGMIIPRPQGVLYDITFPTFPVFGADRNDSYVAGADLGHCI